MTPRRENGTGMSVCPYCSTFANGFRLYGPTHPCFTVYDWPQP